RYTIRDLGGDAKLQEIGAALESSAATCCCLLGEIVVERLSDVKDSVEEDCDDGPDVATDDEEWEPSAKMMRL
ncbi:hypothetical protein MTO96_028574, partial [Rhipicephalus appendiculatus]